MIEDTVYSVSNFNCHIVPVVSSFKIYYWINTMNDNIHLLHAGEGNNKIYSPKSIIFPLGQHPRGIWYSWVNKFSYFLNPHAINVLLYRMKPRKHTHVKYCWQAYFKSIGTLSQTSKNHFHNNCNGRLQVMYSKCLWCFPVKER